MIFNDVLGAGAYLAIAAFITLVIAAMREEMRRADRHALLAILAILAVLAAWRIVGGDDWFRTLMKGEFRQHQTYDRRRNLQLVALIVFAVAGTGGLYAVWGRLASLAPYVRRAALLAIGLLGFGAIRACSLHQIDRILYKGAGPININRLTEAGLLVAIGICVWLYSRDTRRAGARRR